jgi:hypothetical protein
LADDDENRTGPGEPGDEKLFYDDSGVTVASGQAATISGPAAGISGGAFTKTRGAGIIQA